MIQEHICKTFLIYYMLFIILLYLYNTFYFFFLFRFKWNRYELKEIDRLGNVRDFGQPLSLFECFPDSRDFSPFETSSRLSMNSQNLVTFSPLVSLNHSKMHFQSFESSVETKISYRYSRNH